MHEGCNTGPTWFLFATCGRPFFLARDKDFNALRVLKSERRRRIGCTVDLRSGNYAAATIDELLTAWGPDPKIVAANDGSFIYVAPYDHLEERCPRLAEVLTT